MTPIDREKYMDETEIDQLRQAAQIWRIQDLRDGRRQGVISYMTVELALWTGLRVGEMAALQCGDIDLRRQALRVGRLKKRLKPGTKSKKETMAISQELASILKMFLDWKETVDESIAAKSPLFVGRRGPLTRQGLQLIWKKVVKRAGLPEELSIHSARHTAATQALKKTQNLRFVQKMLGHSSPAVTANMYADISFEDMQNGLNGLYGDIGGSGNAK